MPAPHHTARSHAQNRAAGSPPHAPSRDGPRAPRPVIGGVSRQGSSGTPPASRPLALTRPIPPESASDKAGSTDMSDGALRGTRLGATSYENDDHVELAPRQVTHYDCPNGAHHVSMPFSVEAEIPASGSAAPAVPRPSIRDGVRPEAEAHQARAHALGHAPRAPHDRGPRGPARRAARPAPRQPHPHEQERLSHPLGAHGRRTAPLPLRTSPAPLTGCRARRLSGVGAAAVRSGRRALTGRARRRRCDPRAPRR